MVLSLIPLFELRAKCHKRSHSTVAGRKTFIKATGYGVVMFSIPPTISQPLPPLGLAPLKKCIVVNARRSMLKNHKPNG